MKKEYAMYRRPYSARRDGKFVTLIADPVRVRVLSRAEGYAMVRIPGLMVFVVPEKDLEADQAKVERLMAEATA